jgi:hypothetical protein
MELALAAKPTLRAVGCGNLATTLHCYDRTSCAAASGEALAQRRKALAGST